MVLKDELKPLTGSRAGHKQWVTHTLNDLKAAKDANTLDSFLLREGKSSVYSYVAKIEDVETKIGEIYDKYNISLEEASRKTDMEETDKFIWDAKKLLAGFEKTLVAVPGPPQVLSLVLLVILMKL